MENKLDKNIDHLINKVIKQTELETPTNNFTVNLMSKIESLQTSKAIVFKPLISKAVWFVIGLIVVSLFAYSFYSPELSKNNILNYDSIKLPTINLPKINISTTATNSIVLIGVILLIQGALLKFYFNKRINV